MNTKLLLSSAAAACCAAIALAVPAASSAATTTAAASENWAGYEATNGTSDFSAVSGGWVQPVARCTSQGPTYSAFWVGLGGGGQTSSALEQIGTQSNCTAAGKTQYFAWYELVPQAPVKLAMAIHPGDRMYARVAVSGTDVHLTLEDHTTGASLNRALHMSRPDTSTAEWVAEAPSQCTSGMQSCTPLPLSNFGSVRFTNAYATSDGHTGSIGSWNAQPIALAPSSGNLYSAYGYGLYGTGEPTASSANPSGAQPSSLSSSGTGFSVSYQDVGSSQSTSGYGGGSGYGYGYGGGSPYGDGGGYGYGYGYGGGWVYGINPAEFMPY
ncbi:MAG TPA: G1 family glutamic endopeptidase [Solirubrobacteraceae bacterium]|nr:G1 family glutamic endopeptidase [Solirubrobacteraceae bacterium]